MGCAPTKHGCKPSKMMIQELGHKETRDSAPFQSGAGGWRALMEQEQEEVGLRDC